MPLKDDSSLDQVQVVKKHTNRTNLVGEITSPVEQTASIDNNNTEYQMALAKGAVETGDSVSTAKESKPSIYAKVLGC